MKRETERSSLRHSGVSGSVFLVNSVFKGPLLEQIRLDFKRAELDFLH